MEIKKKIVWGDEEGDYTEWKFLLVPGCCEKSIEARRPYLYLNFGDNDALDVNDAAPEWRIPDLNWDFVAELADDCGSVEAYDRTCIPVEFCPFCGKRMPEVKLKDVPPEESVYSGDDHYCDTCDERNSNCVCLPMEALFEVVEE